MKKPAALNPEDSPTVDPDVVDATSVIDVVDGDVIDVDSVLDEVDSFLDEAVDVDSALDEAVDADSTTASPVVDGDVTDADPVLDEAVDDSVLDEAVDADSVLNDVDAVRGHTRTQASADDLGSVYDLVMPGHRRNPRMAWLQLKNQKNHPSN